MPQLLRLLYVSRARPGLDQDDLAAILTVARDGNKASGITGALCFRGGFFTQVLEGPELPVLDLYVKVVRDDRHSEPVLITVGTTRRRIYEGWFMAGIRDDEAAFASGADPRALRNSVGDNDTAPMLMQRWLTLLNAQTDASPPAALSGA